MLVPATPGIIAMAMPANSNRPVDSIVYFGPLDVPVTPPSGLKYRIPKRSSTNVPAGHNGSMLNVSDPCGMYIDPKALDSPLTRARHDAIPATVIFCISTQLAPALA